MKLFPNFTRHHLITHTNNNNNNNNNNNKDNENDNKNDIDSYNGDGNDSDYDDKPFNSKTLTFFPNTMAPMRQDEDDSSMKFYLS